MNPTVYIKYFEDHIPLQGSVRKYAPTLYESGAEDLGVYIELVVIHFKRDYRMQFRNIPDSKNNFPLKPISEQTAVTGFGPIESSKKREQQSNSEKKKKKKVKDYFKTLAAATEAANKQLQQNNSTYRFCVFKKNNNVLIELVTNDSNGNVTSILTKDITNEDFKQWIEDISHIEGLIIDQKG